MAGPDIMAEETVLGCAWKINIWLKHLLEM
jgi:hypothetical protein